MVWHRRWLQFGAFLGAVITSELCIGPLKALVDRPRPPDPLIGTRAARSRPATPIAGAVTAFGLVVVLLPASPRRLMAIGCAAAFAGIMAISRTYLSAHWLTDTLAGVCIGTGLALVWPAALEMAREHHWRRACAASAATRPSVASDLDDVDGALPHPGDVVRLLGGTVLLVASVVVGVVAPQCDPRPVARDQRLSAAGSLRRGGRRARRR